ncbi:MAG: response regulator [Anaerolineae bacterium]|nr:response regulator [Anaerolineae bacterium]
MAKIFAIDDNEINLKVVKTTLAQVGHEVVTATNGVEALERVEGIAPEVIILDISMPIMDGYEVCRKLRENPATAQIPIIILTAYNALEDKIKGFDAGADDYLTKPFQPAELQARVSVILRRSAVAQVTPKKAPMTGKNGKVISLFSMRGGSGVSTIAANLASGLSKIWSGSVALVDLSLAMGQAALMLNLSLRNTWVDLVGIPPEELEPEILEAILLKHENGVHVLAAPRSIADGELITGEIVGNVLRLLRSMYDYVVIDLPSMFSEGTLQAFDASNEIICLLSPELASVRAMIGTLEVLDELEYSNNKNIILMLNRTFDKHGLARKNIEKALKKPIQIYVPFSPEEFINSINFGVPIVMGDPENGLVELFEDLAFLLSTDGDKDRKPLNPTEAYLRVYDRIEKRKQKRK